MPVTIALTDKEVAEFKPLPKGMCYAYITRQLFGYLKRESTIMKMLLATIVMVLSFSALADCQYGEQRIPLGEQLTIRDEHLVEKMEKYLIREGNTPEESEYLARTSDWTVVAVECTRQFAINPDFNPDTSTLPGEQFLYVGDVLVAGMFQRDFLPEVMGLVSE